MAKFCFDHCEKIMSWGTALAADLMIILIYLPITSCGIFLFSSTFQANPRNNGQMVLSIVTLSLYILELIFIILIVSITGFTDIHIDNTNNPVYYLQIFHQHIHIIILFCQSIRSVIMYLSVKFHQTRTDKTSPMIQKMIFGGH